MKNFLTVKPEGLYCPLGDFFIDARNPVPLCLITHAHGDHAYLGHEVYIATKDSLELLKYRLGPNAKIQIHPYGKKFNLKNAVVSFHPSGHILGSAQIRIESENEVCVISGDYKRAHDYTCAPFEPLKCDIFVTESTFALPIYNWDDSKKVGKKIYDWWQENKLLGCASVLFCYALGKAQRILSMLKEFTDQPVYLHGSILPMTEIYTNKGVKMLSTFPITENPTKSFSSELILAPPLAKGSPWLKRFYPYKSAIASGWMAVRGLRKQKNVDMGFVLSDHADWNALLATIKETEAKTVFTTHGNAETLARYLSENGISAFPLEGLNVKEEELD